VGDGGGGILSGGCCAGCAGSGLGTGGGFAGSGACGGWWCPAATVYTFGCVEEEVLVNGLGDVAGEDERVGIFTVAVEDVEGVDGHGGVEVEVETGN